MYIFWVGVERQTEVFVQAMVFVLNNNDIAKVFAV